MTDQQELIEEVAQNWRPKILALGALIGALTGLGAAYLLIQRAEKRGAPPDLSAREGISLGLLVFGLLRQVSLLGSGDEK
ncbi:MAG: hypothetical protein JW726_00640 [Anaerolineales bacterium]|nr:hypothetical protein [Anaerolineales bacterium]